MSVREKGYKKQQDRIPVGTRVAWTVGTFHVNHDGHKTRTGVVVSHTQANGMTQVRPDGKKKKDEFRVVSCVLQPVQKGS